MIWRGGRRALCCVGTALRLGVGGGLGANGLVPCYQHQRGVGPAVTTRFTSRSRGTAAGGARPGIRLYSKRGEPDGADPTRTRTRFRSRVAYCGTHFAGWQLQSNNRSTIQGEIERVLSQRFNRRVPVLGAGRTDAGVHARGQAIHFDLYPHELPFEPLGVPSIPGEIEATRPSDEERTKRLEFCAELQESMSRMLQIDIRVFNLQLAPYTWTTTTDEGLPRPLPWHAMSSSTRKWYSYRFVLGPTLWNPTERFTRTHFVHRPYYVPEASSLRPSSGGEDTYALTGPDIAQLRSILEIYEGTHDFTAFGGQIEQNEKRNGAKINTVRTIYKVELVKEPLMDEDSRVATPLDKADLGFIGEEGNFRIDFLIQGALYKMVRNMVGTAIDVWLGRMSEDQLRELLAGATRKDNRSKPAPPEGLTLECVYYEDGY